MTAENDGGGRRPDYWAALRQATQSTDQENEMSGDSNNDTPLGAPADAANQQQVVEAQLTWDDRKMATSFANVVNIQSTREQVDLFFGTNQTWNVAADRMLSIELSNRVILSPFAAKRLSVALARVISEYEARYGALNVDR
jgi:hypothetical protein